jgi:hypothetical protein
MTNANAPIAIARRWFFILTLFKGLGARYHRSDFNARKFCHRDRRASFIFHAISIAP